MFALKNVLVAMIAFVGVASAVPVDDPVSVTINATSQLWPLSNEGYVCRVSEIAQLYLVMISCGGGQAKKCPIKISQQPWIFKQLLCSLTFLWHPLEH